MDRTGLTYKRLGEISFYPNKRILLADITPQQYVGVETLVKNRGGIYFSDELPNAENAIEFIEEDILIGNIRPYLKKIWKADRKGGASGDVVNIRILPNWKPLINSTYLFMALSSDKFFEYDNANTHGAKMPRGDKKAISEYLIPIPPYDLQNSIVAELDSINESINLLQQQVKDLDTLAQSVFFDMFGDPITNPKGWPVNKIGDVCAPKINIKRASKSFEKDDIINYIDISSIDNSTNQLLGTTEYVYSEAPSRAQQKVEMGDILISLVRPNLKNIAVVDYNFDNLVASSGFCVLRATKASKYYIKSLVTTSHFTDYLVRRVTGANYPAVREEDIKECLVGIPPFNTQESYASKVVAIEETKADLNKQIAEMKKLLASRMQYWFE